MRGDERRGRERDQELRASDGGSRGRGTPVGRGRQREPRGRAEREGGEDDRDRVEEADGPQQLQQDRQE